MAGFGRGHAAARRPSSLSSHPPLGLDEGERENSSRERQKGKRNWSSRPNGSRVAPTRPDSRGHAHAGVWLGLPPPQRGRPEPGTTGGEGYRTAQPRITGGGGGGGGRSMQEEVAAERWGSGAKAWCDVWPVATDTLD
ncbi:hypothetical protein SEVIR_4G294450v4 [Setaria viridis]